MQKFMGLLLRQRLLPKRKNSGGSVIFCRKVVLFFLPIVCGCEKIKETVCKKDEAIEIKALEPPESQQLIYARQRYLENPTELVQHIGKSRRLLHQCWYYGSTKLKLDKQTHLNIALETTASALEVKPLFSYYTSTRSLAEKLQESKKATPQAWEDLGIFEHSIPLTSLARLQLGDERIGIGPLAGLLPLWFFPWPIFEPSESSGHPIGKLVMADLEDKPSETDMSKEADKSKEEKTSDTKKSIPGQSSSRPASQKPFEKINILSKEQLNFLSQKLSGWGMNVPPKEILRLNIDELAKYPCPPF